MLKKKIIASSISNLTDARYFAGWMVDFIVFNIDPIHEFYINPQEIGAFQSWVEGPEYILEMTDDQIANCEKYLLELNCQYVLIEFSKRHLVSNISAPIVFTTSLKEYLTNQEIFEKMNSIVIIKGIDNIDLGIKLIKESNYTREVFFELTETTISEEQLLSEHVNGYLVHGSPEEKVGFKSFDELDEIFEILQDF